MLLVLTDVQKEHLSLLSNVNEEIAKEFCRLAVEFMKNGINAKKYQTAAQKLQLSSDAIQHSVEAIMHVLSESTKLHITEIDFKDSIISLGLSDELNQCLLDCYLANQGDIKTILNELSLVLPHYEDLEWRFDVQLASRMLAYQTTPRVLLKLYINNGREVKTHVLQTDPVNLLHLTTVLEGALAEMKTGHCRRIARSIK